MKKYYSLALGLMMMAGCTTAQNIQLPEPNKNVDAKFMDVLQQRASGREFADREITDATLSQLLWAACGVNRENGNITAPSAINAQDIKLYVVRKDGAYLYLPKENQLQRVSDQDLRQAVAGRQGFAANAPVSLVMVSDQTKFGDRKHGAQLMGTFDAAYVSENICLACTALGLVSVPRMTMDNDALKAGLKLADSDLPMLNNPVGWPAK